VSSKKRDVRIQTRPREVRKILHVTAKKRSPKKEKRETKDSRKDVKKSNISAGVLGEGSMKEHLIAITKVGGDKGASKGSPQAAR